MANLQRTRGYGAQRWRFWFFLLACVTTAVFSAWYHRQAAPGDWPDLEADRPLVAPELWQQPLPGEPLHWRQLFGSEAEAARRLGLNPALIAGQGEPEQVEAERLKAALSEIGERWGTPQLDRSFRTGAAQIVLRLAPPEAEPRAVVALRGGSLYLVERRDGQWQTRQLAGAVQHVAALDLTGDGRPELAASSVHGSGAYLNLQIFAWDDEGLAEAFRGGHGGGEIGSFGFLEPLPDGRRDLWLDHPVSAGLFELGTQGPYIRDRLYFRWEGGTYSLYDQKRLATPFYHLNRYLYLAHRGQAGRAAAHLEPGARIEQAVVSELGLGPLKGGRDHGFVNGRLYFTKEGQPYYADFGPTGRLLRIGRGHPAREEEVGLAEGLGEG